MDRKCATHDPTHFAKPIIAADRTAEPSTVEPSNGRSQPGQWRFRSPLVLVVTDSTVAFGCATFRAGQSNPSPMFDFKIREDYHPCVNCRHGCMDSRHPKFAIDLMEHLPWDFLGLIIHAGVTQKEAAEYAREHGHFLVTWYSEEVRPCAFRYLEGILNVIVFIAFARKHVTNLNDLDLWFSSIRGKVVNCGVKVSRTIPAMFKEEAGAILDCALCYWVQAAIAYDSNEPDVCVGSMMQCNFYIGMADWPKLASEMNSVIGSKRTAHLEDLAMELRRLLQNLGSELNGKKLPNTSTVIDRILDPMIRFHENQIAQILRDKPLSRPKAISDMKAYLTKICTPGHDYYEIVRAEFDNVCARKRGRTPGSRNVKPT